MYVPWDRSVFQRFWIAVRRIAGSRPNRLGRLIYSCSYPRASYFQTSALAPTNGRTGLAPTVLASLSALGLG